MKQMVNVVLSVMETLLCALVKASHSHLLKEAEPLIHQRVVLQRPETYFPSRSLELMVKKKNCPWFPDLSFSYGGQHNMMAFGSTQILHYQT